MSLMGWRRVKKKILEACNRFSYINFLNRAKEPKGRLSLRKRTNSRTKIKGVAD